MPCVRAGGLTKRSFHPHDPYDLLGGARHIGGRIGQQVVEARSAGRDAENRVDAARGTSAGHIAHVHTETAFDQTREMRQGGVQRGDIIGAGPFCGPNTALVPVGPVSGLVTSQAAMMDTLPMSGSIVVMSMTDTSAKAAPPRPSSSPFASRRRTPRDCRRPAPASLVGGAAAETDDDSSNAKTGGGEQQFAGTIG